MDKIYRIGLIVPSANVVIEPEYYSLNLKGIYFYTSRVLGNICTPQMLQTMSGYVEKAATELSTANADVILYACTAASMLNGIDWEKGLIKKISKISQRPSVSTAGSVAKALRFMNISKIHLFTPYIDEINLAEKNFLSQSGVEVVLMKGLGITKSVEIADVEPDRIFSEVLDLYKKDKNVQGIFISCTNLKTFSIIERIENSLNIPVITSNQASLWNLLQIIDYKNLLCELGRLFQ